MLNVIGWAAIGMVIAVCVPVAYAATKPDGLRAARSLVIAGTPGRLLPMINDLREFTEIIPHWDDDRSKQDRALHTHQTGTDPRLRGGMLLCAGSSPSGSAAAPRFRRR